MRSLRSFDGSYLAISILAGIFYDSWPLGYWLNPAVSKSSLASGLEAVGQPYNWLFIGGDIVSSLLVIILCSILWLQYKTDLKLRFVKTLFVSLILFAIGTIVDALLPERCVPNLQVCPDFNHDHLLLLHGIFSIMASLFLFVSLFVLWFQKRHSIVLNCLLVGYIIFGLISLVQVLVPGNHGNWSQHYYITLCSIILACIPYAIAHITDSQVTQS